jgi:hypothetical protein
MLARREASNTCINVEVSDDFFVLVQTQDVDAPVESDMKTIEAHPTTGGNASS